jgi:hypothetical protein
METVIPPDYPEIECVPAQAQETLVLSAVLVSMFKLCRMKRISLVIPPEIDS